MKAPFIIYADFEALIKKIPERERERTMASCTEKTDKHEACGFTFTVVRCDGKSWPVVKYRQGADGQKKAVEEFLRRVLGVQEKSREARKHQRLL